MNYICEGHFHTDVKPTVPKTFSRPWEEIFHNKNRSSLGYNKDVSFHVRDLSKPIQFHSVRFMGHVIRQPQQIPISQHCDIVGHEKDDRYDLHPCEHCGNKNHHSNKCFKNNTTKSEKINFRWIVYWDLSKTTKKIYKSYYKRCLRVLTNLAMKSTSNSHPVSNKG